MTMQKMLLAGMMIFAAVATAHADSVTLSNGNTIEGTVTSEDDKSVTVSVGGGTVVIEKEKIVSMKRDNEGQESGLMGKIKSQSWFSKMSYQWNQAVEKVKGWTSKKPKPAAPAKKDGPKTAGGQMVADVHSQVGEAVKLSRQRQEQAEAALKEMESQ